MKTPGWTGASSFSGRDFGRFRIRSISHAYASVSLAVRDAIEASARAQRGGGGARSAVMEPASASTSCAGGPRDHHQHRPVVCSGGAQPVGCYQPPQYPQYPRQSSLTVADRGYQQGQRPRPGGYNTTSSQNRQPNSTWGGGSASGSGSGNANARYHPYGRTGNHNSNDNSSNFKRNATSVKSETFAKNQMRPPAKYNRMSLVSPQTAGENSVSYSHERFGDPLVLLSCPEAWVNEIMREQFRGDDGVVYDGKKGGAWTFPFSRYHAVLKALKTSSMSMSTQTQTQTATLTPALPSGAPDGTPHAIDELSPTVVSTLSLSPRIKDDSMRYGNIPPAMEAKLMPFQRDGIKFILRRGGRALLGDEMGLGKTVQALGAMSAYRDEWPVMIMCPSSLRESWSVAIQEWLEVPERKIRVVHTGKDAEATTFGTSFQFLVISYGFLEKIKDAGMFNIVVVDESHCLKDWTAKRTKAALPILKKAKRVVLLTVCIV